MHHTEELKWKRLVIFILSIIATAALSFVSTALAIGPNFAGISIFLLPLCCALPISIGLLTFQNSRNKNKGPFGLLLPVLIYPVLFVLLFGYTVLIERNPKNMFRVFVADPIPAGVTDIRAMDISGGFDEEVLITFKAPPEVVDSIVTERKLEKAARQENGGFNFPDHFLPEYQWNSNWVYYRRTLYDKNGHFSGFLQMWVDPATSIVIFRAAG